MFHPNQPPLRIVIQQGVFTICTRILDEHGGIIKTFGTPLHRLVIPAAFKTECLSRLRVMNLSAATLFPDLDGLGVSTAEFIRLTVDERSGEQQTNGPGLSGWSASQAPCFTHSNGTANNVLSNSVVNSDPKSSASKTARRFLLRSPEVLMHAFQGVAARISSTRITT